jgi:hypothetical protein
MFDYYYELWNYYEQASDQTAEFHWTNLSHAQRKSWEQLWDEYKRHLLREYNNGVFDGEGG